MHDPEELDASQRQRLDALRREWDKPAGKWGLETLTLPDLRLLLTHFEPLRDVLRGLSPSSVEAESEEPKKKALLKKCEEKCEELEAALAERERLRCALDDALARAKALEQECGKMRAAQDEERARAQAAERARQQCEQALAALEARSPLGAAAPLLAALRQSPDLARRLRLEGLGEDLDSLVRMVAVLAQEEALTRLIDALSDAAEQRRQPIADGEAALLHAAVAWLNHNWPSLPFRLERPAAGSPFDHDAHRRVTYTPTGETIARCLVPGLRDGMGRWERKPLVETH